MSFPTSAYIRKEIKNEEKVRRNVEFWWIYFVLTQFHFNSASIKIRFESNVREYHI